MPRENSEGPGPQPRKSSVFANRRAKKTANHSLIFADNGGFVAVSASQRGISI
jgi:hypothetical protein